MKKSLYICNATNLESEGNTYRNTAYCVSSRCTSAPRSRGFVAKLGRVRSLFVNTRKTCSTMLQTNKQATKAKNSNLYAPIFKGQALYFGWLLINKTFTNKADAVAWYERHQEGWRYRNAVAVVWQGCTKKTPRKWLKYALCGGEEWQHAINRGIRSQEQCDYILYTNDYELAR